MPLLFSMPSGISDELEVLLAAIQTQFNTQLGGWGKRIDVPYAATNFSAPFNVGTTWTVTSDEQQYYYYAFFGDLMLVSFHIRHSLVTGNPSTLVLAGITGYRVVGEPTGDPRYRFPASVDRDLGLGEAGVMFVQNGVQPGTAGPGAPLIITVAQADDGAFTNSGYTTVAGCAIFPYARL